MAEDFLSKLRMANLFPINQGTPFGMPDLNAGREDVDPNQIFNMIQRGKDLDLQRQLNLDNEMRMRERREGTNKQRALESIAQSSVQPEKNVVFGGYIDDKNKITPYQRESLDIQKQRLGQTGALGEERLDVTRRGQDISSRRADLAEKVASGRATDEEKHEYALELIGARGDVTSRQIGERGDITSRQIGERGNIQKELTGTRGQQRMGEIEAREENVRGREKTDTVTKSGQQVTAQQIINTRPDLAKYISINYDGLVEIDPDTPLDKLSTIQGILYPKKDIELPTSKKKTTPTSTTPTAADLIKKYGG